MDVGKGGKMHHHVDFFLAKNSAYSGLIAQIGLVESDLGVDGTTMAED